jgi:diacylglycerol kinase (ATP)
MSIKVILNPYSNRWNARKRWPEAEAALLANGLTFELAISEGPGHCIELAANAVQKGFSPIVVAGGDGTIGEVVNGLMRVQGNDVAGPLGVIPLGTANDLASNLKIPLDLSKAARVIAIGQYRLMDVGKVNDRYFANNSAIGLEPFITSIQENITWIKGIPRYLVAAVRGIMANPSWNATLEWDEGRYEGPVSLVSVGNAPRTGGLFYMAPHADPFDGKLTFVHGFRPGRLGLLATLPRTMRAGEGSFVEMEGMYEIHTTHLKIRLDKPSPAHADGELFDQLLDDLDYQILPAKLQIFLPE